MANSLDIFYQIFALNYSTEELYKNFNRPYQLTLMGAEAELGEMLNWLGDQVSNAGNAYAHSQLRCLPLPERQSAEEPFPASDIIIVHLGQRLPSLNYLDYCCRLFPSQAEVLFIVNEEALLEGEAELSDKAAQDLGPGEGEPRPAWMGPASKGESSGATPQPPQAPPKPQIEFLSVGGPGLVTPPIFLKAGSSCPSSTGGVCPLSKEGGAACARAKEEGAQKRCLCPKWRHSQALSSFILSDWEGGQVLEPRFDPTLPALYVLPSSLEGGMWAKLLSQRLPQWIYALARDFAVLRQNYVRELILSNANEAALVAAASSLTTSLPLVGWLAGVFAVSTETLYLTAKQMRLALLIGAVYGRSLDFFERMHELWPVLGGAWGWRVLAREAAGFIPALGVVAKAAIAWSGTYTVGALSQRFYERGEIIEAQDRQEVATEARELSRQALGQILGRERE